MRRLHALVFLVLLALPAQASPWMPPPDHGLVSVGYTDYTADDFFDVNGTVRKLTDGRFSSRIFYVYGEHGLSREDAITYALNFLSLDKQSVPALSNSGTGDWMVGWKHNLGSDGNFTHAVELDVGLPTGYNAGAPLPIGLNSLDLTATYQPGITFKVGDNLGYADAYVGYRLRLGTPVDQIVYGGGVGIPPVERVMIFTRINGIKSLGGRGDLILGPSFLANSFDTINLAAGVAYDVGPDFNVSVSHLWDLWGRNSGKGDAWMIGVMMKY